MKKRVTLKGAKQGHLTKAQQRLASSSPTDPKYMKMKSKKKKGC